MRMTNPVSQLGNWQRLCVYGFILEYVWKIDDFSTGGSWEAKNREFEMADYHTG